MAACTTHRDRNCDIHSTSTLRQGNGSLLAGIRRTEFGHRCLLCILSVCVYMNRRKVSWSTAINIMRLDHWEKLLSNWQSKGGGQPNEEQGAATASADKPDGDEKNPEEEEEEQTESPENRNEDAGDDQKEDVDAVQMEQMKINKRPKDDASDEEEDDQDANNDGDGSGDGQESVNDDKHEQAANDEVI